MGMIGAPVRSASRAGPAAKSAGADDDKPAEAKDFAEEQGGVY